MSTMSVFKSLKGTFQNVQQDIVDGFKALTSLESSPRHEKVKKLRADGISLDGGADLLYRYQKEWSELHNYTAETAKKAEEVDDAVADMFTRHSAQWEAVCRLEEESASLPAFMSVVNDMIQLMDSLHADFQTLEEELDQLENLCEEGAVEHEKVSHLQQLAAYKKAKNAESFSVKAKLWNLLKERSKEMETRKSHAMKERQEAFLDAFTSDMDYYRKHGRTDKLPSVTEFPKVSSLSEISIDEDKKALDEFLSSPDTEQHGEDMFIEDDYTADYKAEEELDENFPELDSDQPIDFDNASENVSGAAPSQNSDHNCGEDASTTEKSDEADAVQNTKSGPGETEEMRSGVSQGEINGEVLDQRKVDEQSNVVSADT